MSTLPPCVRLWAASHAEFHGEFVDFDPVTSSPKPVNGNIPILVGGDTPAAIARAVKLADGYFPGEGDIDRLRALIGRVHGACETAGRDPASLEINAMFGTQMSDPKAGIEEMRAAGVGRIMIPAFFLCRPRWPGPHGRASRSRSCRWRRRSLDVSPDQPGGLSGAL